MATREEIDLIVNAVAQGFANVTGDMGKLEKSYGDVALKNELLSQKTAEYQRHIQMLAKGVKDGSISMDDAAKSANDLATKLELSSDGATKSRIGITDLKSAIDIASNAFNQIKAGVQQAWQALGEGAELSLARDKFENLAVSINTTADALLYDMRNATNGMLSDAQLIAGASDIINTGLASNHEQAVRLATAVGTLGLDMQQVILTFANNSKARLDSLGLSISDVDKRTQEFVASGMDANEAFDTAVLEALEAKMELLGDASETTAGQVKIATAEWENLTNAMKESAAVAAGPVLVSANEQITTQKALSQARDRGLVSLGQYIKLQAQLSNPSGREEAERQIATMGKYINSLQHANVSVESYDKALLGVVGATSNVINFTNDLANSYAQTNSQTRELTKSIQQIASVYSEVGDLANRYGDANKTTTAQIFEATKAENARRIEMEKTAAIETKLSAETANFFKSLDNDTLAEYQSILGATTEASVRVAGRTAEQEAALSDLTAEYEKAQEKISSYQFGVDSVGLSEEERAEAIGKQQERMAELQAAMDPLLAVQNEYTTVVSGGTVNQELLNEKIFESIQAHSDNAAAIAIAGEALGIYSTEEAEARLQSALLDEQIRRQIEAWDGTAAGIADVQANINSYINELNNIPTEITTTIHQNFVTTGSPVAGNTAANVSGNAAGVQTFQSGGWTGPTGGIVHPNELVVPSNVVSQGMGAIGEFAQANVPGGVGGGGNTFNIYQQPGEDGAQLARRVAGMVGQQFGNLT